MKTFSYRVGVPGEDAMFLLAGFSDPHHAPDASWRNCAKVFRLAVPVADAGDTRVTFRMRFADPSIRLAVRAGDEAVGEIVPSGAGWGDYALTVPSSAAGGGGPVVLTGEFDREPYDPPAPRLDPNRAAIDLSRVTSEAAEGADLIVPADRTRARIAQAPVRLTKGTPRRGESRLGDPLRPSIAPVLKPPAAGAAKTVFFGDIHVHTNYSACGRPNNGTVEENVAAAKRRGLDFIAITDHCEHMDRPTWRRYFDEIAACAAKYDIVIIPATEWTSRDHGHRNLYFLQPHPPYVDYFMHETNHPAKLGAFFRKHHLDAFAVPHHFPYVAQPGNIGSIAPDVEPVMEIYSHWGSSEHYGARLQDVRRVMPGSTVADALARGLKLGFVGGGDVHNDLPGDGGLTAAIADDLTVEAVFGAIRSRLCYATSGRRIVLDFQINGFPGGSVLTVNPYSIDRLYPLTLSATAVCPGPADRMELIANGALIAATDHRRGADDNEIALNLTIEKQAAPGGQVNPWNQQLVNHSRMYYVRVVQSDGATAWSSPIWIDFEGEWN